MTLHTDPLLTHRGKLLGLAYRMLGSRADAEDVLQDAWLRRQRVDGVDNEEAWLTTAVTRLCLDRLKRARVRRAAYVGPWLPEPVLDAEALAPDAATELADDLSFALLLALERLSPAERAAFLLHDVFDASFAQVAAVLGKSEAACRQLAVRARRALRAERPAPPAPAEAHARLLQAFTAAVASGDTVGLEALLRADAVLLSDGGGVKLAALNPIRGPANIARFFVRSARKAGAGPARYRFEPRTINGIPGFLMWVDGVLDQTLSLAVEGERIVALYVVRNPAKLAGLG